MDYIDLFLSLIDSFLTGSLFPAVLILVIGILLIRIIMHVVSKALDRSKLEKAAFTLVKTGLRAVLYGLLIMIVASALGIDISGIVALASVLTLAFSLALQNILTNVFSGLTLLHTKPFSSGDYVEIAGQGGNVLEVGLTYTKLSTADNKIISIPNSSVTGAEIINYTISGTRRVSVEIAVSYEAPTQQVLEALREAGTVPTILKDKPPFAALSSYGESAINYVLHVWSTTEDYWTTLFSVNERIRVVFAEKGISMTYPHLNVHLDK